MLDDDDNDFPPTLYPGREAVTIFLAIILVISILGIGIWKLCH
jgi:hypothetical protein